MVIKFKEEFLHYIWRFRRFRFDNLQTTCGKALYVLHPGFLNSEAGPDFFDSRIRIGETLWAGNVEIHIKSSDWIRHGHENDKAYDNIILHVVFKADTDVYRKDGQIIPCLELEDHIDQNLISRYYHLQFGGSRIPCQNLLNEVQPFIFNAWLDRLMVERLEFKIQKMIPVLEFHKSDWETTFYEMLAFGFGLKVNAEPFAFLARSLPLSILRKHSGNAFQIEALFFGQSGMLQQDFKDEYPRQLKREYDFLSKKYGLKAINPETWKFLRMRPAGFPTIRIARFAAFIARHQKFFSFLDATENHNNLFDWINAPVSNYWKTHFRFDKSSESVPPGLGESTVNLILINVVIPYLFLYGKNRSNERFKSKAIQWFESIKAEKNVIIRNWEKLEVIPSNAGQSQALIHLKTKYCDKKKCLDCAVGAAVLKTTRS